MGDDWKHEIEVVDTIEFTSKGFTATNLKYMRQFYLAFPNRHTLCDQLSWSHYRLLMRVEDEKARQFYTDECFKSQWSVRQLERQINTFSYQRLLMSSGNHDVVDDTTKREPVKKPEDVIRDPYVLEGRQHRISFDNQHFYIDLVFYNYILKCFVLIDLKTGKLTHQDIGQMQMYVNYYTREMMNEGDNPPIGILLCADKNDSVVRYTLAEDNKQIFASKYKLYLPTEEELRKEISTEREALECSKKK